MQPAPAQPQQPTPLEEASLFDDGRAICKALAFSVFEERNAFRFFVSAFSVLYWLSH
jgi:hypothetical protein